MPFTSRGNWAATADTVPFPTSINYLDVDGALQNDQWLQEDEWQPTQGSSQELQTTDSEAEVVLKFRNEQSY